MISITTLVNAIIDLGDPLHAGWTNPQAPSLASYENYKMDILKSVQKGEDASKSPYIPDDQALRAMFEAAKNDKIQSARHRANQSIIIGSLLIVICAVLFITHWRWMRKIAKSGV